MHAEICAWLAELRTTYPKHFASGCRVLEYGSRDVNGSVRPYFVNPSQYVGIDCYAGRCVDVVGLAHEYEPERADFDVVITTETLEHDPHWRDTLAHAARMLRSGGLLVLTCAAPKRAPHNHADSPEPGYYENREPSEVIDELSKHCEWTKLDSWLERFELDLHCIGVKA